MIGFQPAPNEDDTMSITEVEKMVAKKGKGHFTVTLMVSIFQYNIYLFINIYVSTTST